MREWFRCPAASRFGPLAQQPTGLALPFAPQDRRFPPRPSERHDAPLRIRFQRTGEQMVAHFRLGGREAAEIAGQAAQLAHICGEHLQQRIREPELEDAPSDDRIERLLPHHQPRPCLLPADGLGVAHGVGVVGGEAGGHVQAVDLVFDGIGTAGGHALHLHLHGEAVAGGVLGLAEQNRVIPRLAGHGRAVGTGALRHEVGQLGAYRPRADAQMEGQVLGVDAQVAHAAVVAVDIAQCASS